jgi:hypothetical protein
LKGTSTEGLVAIPSEIAAGSACGEKRSTEVPGASLPGLLPITWR